MKRSDSSHDRSKCGTTDAEKRNERRNYTKKSDGKEERNERNKDDVIPELDGM